MAKHNDQVFKRVVTGGLQKQHTAGVAQGAYAMCKVVLDKATAYSIPPIAKNEERNAEHQHWPNLHSFSRLLLISHRPVC